MIWIDRLALVCAGVLWGGMALLANGHGQPGDALHPEVLKTVALLVGAPWLVLRGVRFAIFGAKPNRLLAAVFARRTPGLGFTLFDRRPPASPIAEILPPIKR